MKFPQKIKNRTSIQSTSRYLPEEYENTNSKDIRTPMFTEALFTAVNMWKQPKCPLMNEWIKNL